MSAVISEAEDSPSSQPFDSVRDYVNALEARGHLLRIESMDQDAYEITGLAYRLIDRFGIENAPGFLVERMKIDGRWIEGPIVANIYGRWPDEALLFGIENITDDYQAMYKAVIAKLQTHLDGAGAWKRIPPVEVAANAAPVKDVVVTGDAINIEDFAWLKNNPADAGRYINMGSVFIQDPEIGCNVGTYRCQVKGPRKIGVNPEPGQHGARILRAMKERGDKSRKLPWPSRRIH